jgi:hypothetical protein
MPPLPNFYTAQSGDNISEILGTSAPTPIGNFILANGLTNSKIYVGQTYVIPSPDDPSFDGAEAVGQAALDQDNQSIAAQVAISAQEQQETTQQGVFLQRFNAGLNVWTGQPVDGTGGSSSVPLLPTPLPHFYSTVPNNDGSGQIGLVVGGALIPGTVGLSVQTSAGLVGSLTDLGNSGLTSNLQFAGGLGLGGYVGAGGGLYVSAASSTPHTLLVLSFTPYAEVDTGEDLGSISASGTFDKDGNYSVSDTKDLKLGPGFGGGVFGGFQGSASYMVTPNSVVNFFRGKWVTLPNGNTAPVN